MTIRDEVARVLKELCLLDPGARILLGVSGGPDSMCLLDVLCSLDYSVIVGHLDHGLRAESAADAVKVAGEAQKRGLAFVTRRVNVNAMAKEAKLSVEEAARTARYEFLFGQAAQQEAQAVAVAHTADDQVETVLMHLLRGSGLAGLKGMFYRSLPSEWNVTIPLLRPMLGTWRSEVEAYCREHHLETLTDATNTDITYFRNRLRFELIPCLQSYNPQIKAILWRTAQNLAGDYEDQQKQVRKAWDECGISVEEDAVVFPSRTAEQSTGVQRSLLRRAAALIQPTLRDLDFASIERGVAFIREPSVNRRVDLVGGLSLAADHGRIYLFNRKTGLGSRSYPAMLSREELTLPMPGSIRLQPGWEIDLQEVTGPVDYGTLVHGDPDLAYLDADMLEFPLTIRSRQPGERFNPLGMEGNMVKISDFWINRRVPRRARDLYPLVCSGEKVAWIPGCRMANFCRIQESTQRVIRLRLLRPKLR